MMRLPWGKRQHAESEATAARRRAEADLERVKAETAYYAALGESLRQLREANHLTELFFVNRHRTREQQ